MWIVDQPEFDAVETFSTCISKVKNPDLKRRLVGIKKAIGTANESYAENAISETLNLIPAMATIGTVTAKEMVKVYDYRMAGKDGPGRAIYDQIKLLPADDRCPFCDQRNVSTLDHVLPKALYPQLAVAPLNLVGACMECNKIKLDLAPQSPEEVVLHPYFDDITSDLWLVAEVLEQSPCAVIFKVVPPPGWSDTLIARVNTQFSLLKLAKLYASEAAREMSNIRYDLGLHLQSGGSDVVRAELRRQWQSRRANKINSWQTAFYQGISHSEWFCEGGFQ
jgi:hypothetical protein